MLRLLKTHFSGCIVQRPKKGLTNFVMRPEALLLVTIPRPLMYSAEARYMDREFLLGRLAQAEQRVAEGKASIAKQQQMESETVTMLPSIGVSWKPRPNSRRAF